MKFVKVIIILLVLFVFVGVVFVVIWGLNYGVDFVFGIIFIVCVDW